MVSLNELCNLTDPLGAATPMLRQACTLPRSQTDMNPLPEPHGDFPFDSAWEALLTGTDLAEHWRE